MNAFIKYLLFNLLIFVPLIILVYWVATPSTGSNSVSAAMKQRFIAEIDDAHQRYNQFKKSMETNDLSQREQDKINLTDQLARIKTTFNSTSALGEIATIVVQNYEELINKHVAASGNKSEINKQKEILQKEIKALEDKNRSEDLTLSVLKSQSTPQSVP